MSDDILLGSRDGTVARLVLNRPLARNALSLAMLESPTGVEAARSSGAFTEKRAPHRQSL